MGGQLPFRPPARAGSNHSWGVTYMVHVETGVLVAELTGLDRRVWLPDTHDEYASAYEEFLARLDGQIALRPGDTYLAAMRSDVLLTLGRREEAREQALSVLAGDPDPRAAAFALCVLAACADASHRDATGETYSPDGTEYYREALRRNPGDDRAAAMLADRLFDGCGDDAEALAVIDEALRVNPDSPALLAEAAFVKRSRGPYGDVVAHLLRLAELEGLNASRCSTLAVAYARLGDYGGALLWCRRGRAAELAELASLDAARQRPGIAHPFFEEMTDRAVGEAREDAEDLGRLAYLAMCFWHLPAIGAQLVADVIIEGIDLKAPKRFEALAERAAARMSDELLRGGAFEYVPVVNPWPPGTVVSPLGRMFRVVVLDDAGEGH